MRVVKRLRRPWGAAGIALLAFLLFSRPASAYLPPLEDLLERLVEGAPSVNSAILEFYCFVYPIAPGETGTAVPQADRSRGFRQRVYWQRGAVLAVETMADDGTPLHVYLSEGLGLQQANLTAARRFSEADVRPLIFPFLEGKPVAWREELAYWGILPAGVRLFRAKEGQRLQIEEAPGKALWIDPESGQATQLATRIDGGAESWQLAMEFGDFTSFATRGPEKDNPRIPRRISYSLNGRRFKEVRLVEFEADAAPRKFPLARLRQLIAEAPGAAAGSTR